VAAPRPTATGRVGVARNRQHGVSSSSPEAAPAPSSEPANRTDLRLVPRRRIAINAALLLGFVLVVLMLGTVVLHTRLAERQVEIDELEQAVTDARSRFDLLRQQRAELRSPTRLAIEAERLLMIPAPRTEFLDVDPQTVAEVLASAGIVDEATGTISAEDPLEQIRKVRSAEGPGD